MLQLAKRLSWPRGGNWATFTGGVTAARLPWPAALALLSLAWGNQPWATHAPESQSLTSAQQAIADLFDAHMVAELDGDLEATMATMVEEPHLLNLPSGTGGLGAAEVRSFYANDLIGQFFPPDAAFIPISRTIDGERLVDELVIRFTHDRVISHLLPGVLPTGRSVELALVVVGARDGKVAYEHIYWDQAGLLAQLGLIDPTGLPVSMTTAARLLAATGKGWVSGPGP